MQPHKKSNGTSRFTAKIFFSAQEIPDDHWARLLGDRSCSLSTQFWDVIDRSGLNDFDYRHVLFYDESGQPAALASYYSITTDIAIFAPPPLRVLLSWIRKVFPNFLKVRMLECGTPITVNSPPFATADGSATREIVDALSTLLLRTARAEGQFIIVIRDFEPDAAALEPEFRRHGFHSEHSLPNTYMDIVWSSPQAYLDSMKSYYRSKLLRHLRRNEALNVRHELVNDFHDLAETLCAQWLNVHHQADEFQREVLTPAFYREFSLRMGTHSKALLFYRQNELVGHALLLMDGELLRWLYIGRKEAINDSLYIYAAHKVVETAIMLGAKQLELGLTTYSIKQDLGAQITPIKLALRSASPLINPFVGLGYALLNRTPRIQNKNIFKNDDPAAHLTPMKSRRRKR